MLDLFSALIASAFAVAMVTALLLPGRQTPAVEREGGTALAKIINASLGRG